MSDPRIEAAKRHFEEWHGAMPDVREISSLLAAIDAASAPKTRTVRVRVAVAVDPSGAWVAYGNDALSTAEHDVVMDAFLDIIKDGENRFWLTAGLPIPKPQEVQAAVESEG